MGEVDDTHQPEDQGEACRDEEIERPERDPAEKSVEKDLFAAPARHEPRWPRGEHEPEEHRDQDRDDQAPDRIALDDVVHRGRARSYRWLLVATPLEED